MLLSCGFVDGRSWQLGLTTGYLTGLIYEVLQQIALVLGQKQNLGLLDDTAKIGYKVATFFRQFR